MEQLFWILIVLAAVPVGAAILVFGGVIVYGFAFIWYSTIRDIWKWLSVS